MLNNQMQLDEFKKIYFFWTVAVVFSNSSNSSFQLFLWAKRKKESSQTDLIKLDHIRDNLKRSKDPAIKETRFFDT